MELAVQRKDDEGQEEELSEELKRFMIQEIVRRCSSFEEALLVFEPDDLDLERHMEFSVDVQNAIQCHLQREKKSNYQTPPDHFFKRVGFLISARNQNLCRQCQA